MAGDSFWKFITSASSPEWVSWNHQHAVGTGTPPCYGDRDATETVLKEFASPSCPVPFSKIARTKFTKFLPRFLPKVEALTADGASDEQLALSMMFDGGGFPNLKVITRDLAHSMRRVASRTSFADPYLRKVFLSKDSKC